ncbi:MAG TPA: type III pantothenate kinase [candidate division WOR-3 bacterium]|uniref:Type III pantothenate kinase n=1 Tax=candidate division WOR-3 bacterium TaxID=2052148 RepID=A0A9C9ELV6_UNCW3|nr:type III pantothenate kinase [candidate division WOR-3 bacterium]
MVAAVDIGNSNIHCGLFRGRRLRKKIVYPLIHKNVVNKVIRELRREEIKGAAISSVVPSFTYRFAKLLQHNFGVLPIIVSAKTASFLKFDYYRPETLGADRIANAVGGLVRYRKNLIIIDFGTAVTFDVVLRNGRYLGGIIVPGALASLDSLVRQTALLKPVPYKERATLIGRSTEECIQSGIFNGTVAMVSGLVRQIKRRMKKRFLCVATGGWGERAARRIQEIDCFYSNLCLNGIMEIYYYNVEKRR